MAHTAAAVPADDLARFDALFAGPPPDSLDAVAGIYTTWFRATVQRWAEGKSTADDVPLLNSLLDLELITNRHEQDPDLARLIQNYRLEEQHLPTPRTANGMADVDPPFNYRLNIRGNYDELGSEVPRGWLRMLSPPDQQVSTHNSGRRELVEWVASSDNPLTARVFVNRVWHWLFGSGLVRTNDDFGHLGDRPSHPELLDDLASRFIASGWSVKWLVREIVCSETWRQSGLTSPEALRIDPDNRLLHHVPLRRLEAEAIRDAMLSASGRLDARLFGPPVNPHRANEDPQKRLFSGPVDGLGRRSLYLKMTIMEPPRFLAAFNQPSPKIPTGRRDVTNTPAQSLALLNDPLTARLSEEWAQRMIRERDTATIGERVNSLFVQGLGRPATPGELSRWSAAVEDLSRLHQVSPNDVLTSQVVWRDVAHSLFNLKEFIDLR